MPFMHWKVQKGIFLWASVTSSHSAETLRFYKFHLGIFGNWGEENGLNVPEEIRAQDLRSFFAQYQEHRTRNGNAIEFRTVKALFRWAWDEYEFDRKNPAAKISYSADPILSPITWNLTANSDANNDEILYVRHNCRYFIRRYKHPRSSCLFPQHSYKCTPNRQGSLLRRAEYRSLTVRLPDRSRKPR